MDSTFVIVSPQKRAPRSARRRRKEPEAAKLAESTNPTETIEPSNDGTPSTTADPVSSPPEAVEAPSPPATIWEKRKSARKTVVSAQSAPSKVIAKAVPFRARRIPSSALSTVRSRTAPRKQPDISSEEHFPALGTSTKRKKNAQKETNGLRTNREHKTYRVQQGEAAPYNPDEVDMARKRTFDLPAYSADSGPLDWRRRGSLSSRSTRYRAPRVSSAEYDLTLRRGAKRLYVPGPLRKALGRTTDKTSSNETGASDGDEPQRKAPSTSSATPTVTETLSASQSPSATEEQTVRTATICSSSQTQCPSSSSSPPPKREDAATSIAAPKQSTISTPSEPEQKEMAKPTEKYLELRKGGIEAMRAMFRINDGPKRLHDVSSVKKQIGCALATSIAANAEYLRNECYFPRRRVITLGVGRVAGNGDLASLHKKSVSLSAEWRPTGNGNALLNPLLNPYTAPPPLNGPVPGMWTTPLPAWNTANIGPYDGRILMGNGMGFRPHGHLMMTLAPHPPPTPNMVYRGSWDHALRATDSSPIGSLSPSTFSAESPDVL